MPYTDRVLITPIRGKNGGRMQEERKYDDARIKTMSDAEIRELRERLDKEAKIRHTATGKEDKR